MPGAWMTPLNKLKWMKAFKAKQSQVKIDGRLFNCNYKKRPGYVWVAPASGIGVPCGWFDLNVVTKSLWIDDDKAVRKSRVDS